MAAIVAELKVRLAEITTKVDGLRTEIVAIEGQKTAFETGIRSYESTYVSRALAPAKRSSPKLDVASKRVTELLKGRNTARLGAKRLVSRREGLRVHRQENEMKMPGKEPGIFVGEPLIKRQELLAPKLVRDIHGELQLGPLLVFTEDIAFLGGGETAL